MQHGAKRIRWQRSLEGIDFSSQRETPELKGYGVTILLQSERSEAIAYVYLYEQDWDRAIAVAEKSAYDYNLREKVADSVINYRPDWVKRNWPISSLGARRSGSLALPGSKPPMPVAHHCRRNWRNYRSSCCFYYPESKLPNHPLGNDTQFQCNLMCIVIVCHEQAIPMFGCGNASVLAQIKERG
jgi:hypothetical protein